MVIYDCGTVRKLCFSPYTRIHVGEKEMILQQTVFQTELCLEADQKWSREFCRILGSGARAEELQEHLRTMFSKEDAQNFARMLIGKGLIE